MPEKTAPPTNAPDLFSRAFQAVPAILSISRLADGKYVEVNEALERALGLSRDEIIGRTSRELGIWEDPSDRDRLVGLLRRKGKVRDLEVRLRHRTGRVFTGSLSAEIIEVGGEECMLALTRDITAIRKTELSLLESEERFRTLAEASYEGIAITEQGRILDVNEQLTQILGYDRSELIGRNVADLLPPGERDRVMANIVGGQESRIAHEMLCGDGSRRIVEARARTIRQQGRQLRITAIRDITERKRAEEKIEILNTDLMARAAELEAVNGELEAFSYTVSHDLRKPLTVINGYSQIILDRCGDALNEECTGHLREICNGTLRMNSLIEALLKFSMLTQVEIKRERVDLSGLAHFIATGLRMTEPGRAATFTIAEGVDCSGEADLLGVVLENLLGNAWKYTAGKRETVIEFGAVQCGTGSAKCGSRAGFRIPDSENETVYFVRDNGAGFDMAQADKLFVPFQRLHGAARFQGHGIGLATVHRIIKRHGGQVWAEGEPGKGATFYFTLPEDPSRA